MEVPANTFIFLSMDCFGSMDCQNQDQTDTDARTKKSLWTTGVGPGSDLRWQSHRHGHKCWSDDKTSCKSDPTNFSFTAPETGTKPAEVWNNVVAAAFYSSGGHSWQANVSAQPASCYL